MQTEIAFQLATSNIRYGCGATREVGMDLAELGASRVLVFTDPVIHGLPPFQVVIDSLEREKIEYDVFNQVRVEPTDKSLQIAIEAANAKNYDAFAAIGGGSTIDTAKAANLYSCQPAPFLDYVNAPIGKGKPVPGMLKPLIAIPTTAGTGSETTGVIIFDLADAHVKTGIAHRKIKPTLGLVDPDNTRSMPSQVAASTGLDVLCHAIESYTAIPYSLRALPERPIDRPAYQGSNPISDLWALQALRMCAQYLPRAAADTEDHEARANMILASTYAGIGFGNAGVHLPHGMSYPVAGKVRGYHPDGYPNDHPMVPHGISVILNAPAVFRFTAMAGPERHLAAAEALGCDISNARLEDAGEILADCIIHYMQVLKMPNGLNAVGYTTEDIPSLVQGTLPQHRVTKLSPRPASEEDLAAIFADAMKYW